MSKIFPRSANALPLQIVIFLCVLGAVAALAFPAAASAAGHEHLPPRVRLRAEAPDHAADRGGAPSYRDVVVPRSKAVR